MMKYVMVSVYDRASQCFAAPQFCATAAQALRGFRDQVNSAESGGTVHAHPEDFDLYELGVFSDDDGSFVAVMEDGKVKPRLVARGQDLKVAP